MASKSEIDEGGGQPPHVIGIRERVAPLKGPVCPCGKKKGLSLHGA